MNCLGGRDTSRYVRIDGTYIYIYHICIHIYVCARLLLINPKGQAWPRSVFELTNRFLRYSFIVHVTISRVIDVILIGVIPRISW